MKTVKLHFFGDSICFGQLVSPHHGWVTRLAASAEKLARKHGAGVRVQNPSQNGNTTRQALERMAFDVQQHTPDLLVTQFGLNDCNYWATDKGLPRVSIKSFEANLEEIIARGRKFGAQEVIIPTNHITTRTRDIFPHTKTTYEESNRRYNASIRAVAKRTKATLVDMEEIFLKHTRGSEAKLKTLLLDDQLHLSIKGHDIYYDAFLPVIERAMIPLLKRRTS